MLSTTSSTTRHRLILLHQASSIRQRSKTSIRCSFDKKVSAHHKKLLKKGLEFFGDYLFSNKIKPFISFHFNVTYIRDHGMIEVQEYVHRKPRMFEVTIKKTLCDKSFISTLAHELVHAKQYAYGRLSEFNFIWEGKDYTGKSYFELPWEQEARMIEHFLFELYKDRYGKNL